MMKSRWDYGLGRSFRLLAFDRIVVETTGMANPGPVAQTFFVDDDVQGDFRIDGR